MIECNDAKPQKNILLQIKFKMSEQELQFERHFMSGGHLSSFIIYTQSSCSSTNSLLTWEMSEKMF